MRRYRAAADDTSDGRDALVKSDDAARPRGTAHCSVPAAASSNDSGPPEALSKTHAPGASSPYRESRAEGRILEAQRGLLRRGAARTSDVHSSTGWTIRVALMGAV